MRISDWSSDVCSSDLGPDSKIPNTNGYRSDVMAALEKLHIPVIRWPGGCFADQYDWRDGIGPREKRPVRINYTWGGVTYDNSFGTNEFMNYTEKLGADAYIAGNMGRSEEHTSELQSLMRISYAGFCLKKKT